MHRPQPARSARDAYDSFELAWWGPPSDYSRTIPFEPVEDPVTTQVPRTVVDDLATYPFERPEPEASEPYEQIEIAALEPAIAHELVARGNLVASSQPRVAVERTSTFATPLVIAAIVSLLLAALVVGFAIPFLVM